MIVCSKTSVTTYQSMLHNIPERWRSHLHHGRNLKSRNQANMNLLLQTFCVMWLAKYWLDMYRVMTLLWTYSTVNFPSCLQFHVSFLFLAWHVTKQQCYELHFNFTVTCYVSLLKGCKIHGTEKKEKGGEKITHKQKWGVGGGGNMLLYMQTNKQIHSS